MLMQEKKNIFGCNYLNHYKYGCTPTDACAEAKFYF